MNALQAVKKKKKKKKKKGGGKANSIFVLLKKIYRVFREGHIWGEICGKEVKFYKQGTCEKEKKKIGPGFECDICVTVTDRSVSRKS
jgi:hypothetical protein